MVLVLETVNLGYCKFIFDQYRHQKMTAMILNDKILSYYLSSTYYMPGPLPKAFQRYLIQVTIQTRWWYPSFYGWENRLGKIEATQLVNSDLKLTWLIKLLSTWCPCNRYISFPLIFLPSYSSVVIWTC